VNRGYRLLVFVAFLGMLGVVVAAAQDAPPPSTGSAPPQQGRVRVWQSQEGGQRPLFGKITAMRDGAMDITRADGQVVTVKLTDQTEFRKDREAAKITDFKVGDLVMVRGDENPDHSVTAKLIGTRTGGPGGGPGSGGGMMAFGGTLGKDFVIGEVKSVDSPRLTVLRPDNVTQTLELNEDTTLRKGRESITMADIQVGDHVVAHGGVQNDVFVPKGVMVINAEQWKRMQEMGVLGNAPKAAGPETPAPKPQE
jgi:hypothetical protein